MNPIAMLTVIVALSAAFAWSANRRWQLLKVGRPEDRTNDLGERLRGTFIYAFAQKKMRYYPLAGAAHMLIFVGFGVLLLRTLTLWGRGFDPAFNLFVLGPEGFLGLPLGTLYEFAKDLVAMLVVAGAAVFIYYRVVKREARMTLSGEGVLILGIIVTMMIADMLYDGASLVLLRHHSTMTCSAADAGLCERIAKLTAHYGTSVHAAEAGWRFFPDPAGSLFAAILDGVGPSALTYLALAGFWAHSTLVLIFANLLPHSKHFHIITAIPNVFARNIEPPGRLPKVAENAEKIGEMVMAAAEEPEKAAPVGVSRIEHFTWKAILDFYTCTECGRCSDNCPAHKSGKILSPKQLTLDLRDHLYGRENEFLNRPGGPKGLPPEAPKEGEAKEGEAAEGSEGAEAAKENPVPTPEVVSKPVDLIGNVIHPDVLWACTTCRACEEQCPVMISYVDKIVSMRRHLVMVKGEFPAELGQPVPGHGGQRQPVEPGAHRPRELGRGARRAAHVRQPQGAGALLGRLRGQLRRPRQEDRPRHGQAAQGGGRGLRDPRAGGDVHG
ncbi:MAG: (Fe-S)-binding protein [Minicystis sp.]